MITSCSRSSSLAVHDLDEHERMEGRPPTTFVARQLLRLPNDPLRRGDLAYPRLHRLSVVLPLLVLGTFAAVVFHQKFRCAFLRGLFILPMMATPVAIALIWTMMFHPQLGVLNYLPLVGIRRSLGVSSGTVIPRWCWSRPGNGRRCHADRARRLAASRPP
jgi:hypothetical protein